MDALFAGGQLANGGEGSQSLMHAPEAERIIDQLVPMAVQDVGTTKWNAQGQNIQRLNLQAHYNAQQHAEEFVVELLVSLDKMQVLVQNLLAIEVWKEKVLPHLHRHLAHNVDKVVSYMVLYHEVTLANLLEVTLYHSHAAEALPEEHLLELADWCYRKLRYLNDPQGGRRVATYKELSAQQLMAMGPEEELDAKVDETNFGAAMCCLSILRYLTDGLTTLPMGLLSRVVATNDTLMALVPLLDQPPWVRRRPNGVFEKWMNNQWQAVEAVDRFRLSQADAQVWLTVTNLVVEPKSRAKYGFDEWRRDRLLTLKRFMNELLFDQIPVLKDLQRVLDEMALGVGSDPSSARNAALILEAVPVLRTSLLAVPDWRGLALSQAQSQFSPEGSRQAARALYESLTQSFDFMADFMADLGGLSDPAKAQNGSSDSAPLGSNNSATLSSNKSKGWGPGPVRLSSWRKVHDSGIMEAWSDYVFELDPSKPPEPVSLEHLQGLRYRLLPMDLESTRPLPISGKAVVRCNENPSEAAASATKSAASSQDPLPAPATLIAEALISLPEVALRSKAGEQPPIVWVTIGLLATDGLALQLKLKRADKPRERDRVLGVWCAYHPVGGALTVVRNQGSTARTAATTSVAMSTTATTAKAAADAKAAGNHVGNANPVLSTNTSAAGSLGEAVQSSSAHGGGEALLQPGRLPDQTAGPMDSSAHELDGAHQQQLQQQQQQQQEGQQIPEASGRSPGERDGECQDGSPASTRDYQRQQQQEGKSRAVFGHSKEEAEMAKAEAEVGRLALHAQDEGEEADALDLPD